MDPTASVSRYFISMDTSHVQMLSDALSTITILSCLFLKVPQILNIRAMKSARGIYVQAVLLEIIGFTIVILYNYTNRYSVMTYMEYPIILLQLYIMLFYILKYKDLLHHWAVPLSGITYIYVVVAFVTENFSKTFLSYVLPLVTPLNGFAKVSYMYGIVKAGNADTVSLATWVISVATNSSRLFTVYVDSADTTLMFNFIVSIMLSSMVLFTAIYYKRVSYVKPKEE